ncbi:hypothetical protein H0H87_000654, partial [Tephrocybe sp. NHM501043]
DSQIDDQISVLNNAYANAGIQWTLANTTRTVNADWFNNAAPENAQQTAMKEALRQGGGADLNVYSVGLKSGDGEGLLGYATFPAQYADAPQDDGVVINYSSLPGGAHAPYNLGQPVTGWASTTLFRADVMGTVTPLATLLLRKVLRTAALKQEILAQLQALTQSVRLLSCVVTPCSDAPSDNFMDYTDDSCMNDFTPGQAERAASQINTYRL